LWLHGILAATGRDHYLLQWRTCYNTFRYIIGMKMSAVDELKANETRLLNPGRKLLGGPKFVESASPGAIEGEGLEVRKRWEEWGWHVVRYHIEVLKGTNCVGRRDYSIQESHDIGTRIWKTAVLKQREAINPKWFNWSTVLRGYEVE
jgi:hypothetical protein